MSVTTSTSSDTRLSDEASRLRSEKRGLWTVVGAFAICPCHLPFTLALLGLALGGTAAGAFLHDNLILTGVVITTVWAALTLRGLWLLRRGRSCPIPGAARSTRPAWPASLSRRR